MDLLAGHDLVNKNGSKVLANHALKVTMSHKSVPQKQEDILVWRLLDLTTYIFDIIKR